MPSLFQGGNGLHNASYSINLIILLSYFLYLMKI